MHSCASGSRHHVFKEKKDASSPCLGPWPSGDWPVDITKWN